MMDPAANRLLKPMLSHAALVLKERNIHPDHITLTGFGFGVIAACMIGMGWFKVGLLFIIINRTMDGLDGALARQTKPTDAGGFLDICLDFLFYSGVVAGFGLADPAANASAAIWLLFCFTGTGTSFLAFAIMARKNGLDSQDYPHKSIYYMGGLTEGTETILLFVLMCLLPQFFSFLAYGFSILCIITITTRIVSGYLTLQAMEKRPKKQE